MKLSTRLGIIVACAALGTLVLGTLNLQSLRATMMEERRAQIKMVLMLTQKQVETYIDQEKSGKLSRTEAQDKAKLALSGLHNGDDYVFVRDMAGTMLVHPDPRREGKVDLGSKMGDGRTTFQMYLDAIKTVDMALVETKVKRPNSEIEVPKINGVIKVSDWGWMIGFGQYADDIDTAYWNNALHFIFVGLIIFVLIILIAFIMARNIYVRLGGEPDYATESAKAIANGNLGVEIKVKENDNDSLMASLKVMQMKLKNIVASIQENSATLNDHVQNFEATAQTYAKNKDENTLSDLLRIVKKLGRTVDILNKSVSRFKS